MGAKTFEMLKDEAHYAWLVWCPACNEPHLFDGRWTFNGNHEQPSFQASMLVHGFPDEKPSPEHPRCHSFLTDGVWNYCADSTHEHAGKSLPAPDWADTRWSRMRPDGVVPAPDGDAT